MEAAVSAANIHRWTGIGLLGLPLYGVLTLWSSLDPQPDPGTDYDAWARFVTTDRYVLSHLAGSILGLILGVFGTFALGAWLAPGRSGRLGLGAAVMAITGVLLFLPAMGVSTFAAPVEGQAYLAGIRGLPDLPPTLADTAFAMMALAMIVLLFTGNLLLGVAVWRSTTLPVWTGALWGGAAILMYPLGLVYAALTGSQSTPVTVPAGAALAALAGMGIAWSALRRP
jgi:hypothetical protein